MTYASQRYSADTTNSKRAELGDGAFDGFSRTRNGQAPGRESQFRMLDPVLPIFLLSLSVLFHNSSCSNGVRVNNSDMRNSNIAQVSENQTGSIESSQSNQIVASNTPANLKDVVTFDGKNYIKKSGWNKPSKNDSYIDETYDQGDPLRFAKSGKQVKTNTIHYGFRKLSPYSEDFYFEGQDLDYLKGKLDLVSFLEMSAKGKVFFYSVTAQKVVPNNDLPEGPFGYKIMDTDGDGVFETLLGDYDEIIVPNWVLR